MNLGSLRWLRTILVETRMYAFRRVFGIDIHPSVQMSLSAKLDLTFPKGIHVGENTYLAFESRILSHDRTRGLYLHTRIGKDCFIGGRSLILPGITIGNGCIVGAGSVVTRDVPDRTIVAGNPAVVIRSDVTVGAYGQMAGADATEQALRDTDPDVARLSSRERNKRLGAAGE